MNFRIVAAAAAVCLLAGCSSIAAKTNRLSDERILSQTAGVIGTSPGELRLVDRRTEGTNTYVTVRTAAGASYACVINGGNLLSFGMTNPPVCNKK